jgi:hypothetical protein
VYDEEGNLLDEKPIDANEVENWKKISTVRNKVEDLIQQAKGSKEGMDFLVSSVMNIEASLGHILPTAVQTRRDEYEGFIGCQIPDQINIHAPTDVLSKGKSKESRSLRSFLNHGRERMPITRHHLGSVAFVSFCFTDC